MLVNLADVVDAADIGMGDLARHAHFVSKQCQGGFIAAEALGQELQRDRLAELEIVGLVNLAHAAPAEQADYTETLAERSARQEAAVTAARIGVGRTPLRGL
jgi:hypothetical protein